MERKQKIIAFHPVWKTELFIYRLIIAILPEIIPNWITVGAPFNEQQPDALALRLMCMAVQKVLLFSKDDLFLRHVFAMCSTVQKLYRIYCGWHINVLNVTLKWDGWVLNLLKSKIIPEDFNGRLTFGRSPHHTDRCCYCKTLRNVCSIS